jgi:hypothetical protein
MFQTEFVKKIKTRVLCFEIMCEKCGIAGEVTADGAMLRRRDVICMPDN